VRFWLSALIDGAVVVVFTVIGRLSHSEPADLPGIWRTAWPFLAGAAIGTLLARAWRHPGSLADGLVIWACTLVVGMLLRVLTGETIAVSFVVVTAVVLGVLLVGWRVVCHLIVRARTRTAVGA
jgi:hypothetical protein